MARIDLNDNWLFTPVWTEAFGRGDPIGFSADDDAAFMAATSWQTVRLPHTCREVPFNYFDESLYQMVSGYRRVIDAPTEWLGKRIILTIGAAGHSAEVYLNGTFLKDHHCGYTAFTVELTDHLLLGKENVLAIKVNSREDQDIPPFGFVIDYMTYGGLYREVSLEIKEAVYLEDVFIKPYVRSGGRQGPLYIDDRPLEALNEEEGLAGRVDSEVTLNGDYHVEGRELCLRQRVLPYIAAEAGDAEGKRGTPDPGSRSGLYDTNPVIADFPPVRGPEPLAVDSKIVDACKTGMRTWHGEGHLVRFTGLDMPQISLWSPDSPALYILRTELISVRAEKPKTVLTAVHKALRGEDVPASINDPKGGILQNIDGEKTLASALEGQKDIADATLTGILATDFDADEILLDTRDDVFGFRTLEFRKDGFYLNGAKTKFIGLNRHQSWPYVGYAMPASQQRLDADILKKELGLNAVRTSHYPQSPHFIRRCDEIGLLVFTEAPGWQHIGGTEWKEQGLRNVEDMVLQYRNHPSIFLWGTRINESVDDDDFYAKTAKCAKALDPTRPVSGVRCFKKSHLLEDVYAYNDFSHNGVKPGCEPKKAVTSEPDKAYFISECNGHMFPTKAFDNEAVRLEHALRHATVMDAVLGEADIAGLYEWCLFDYNTHKDFGSGDRVCYHGVLDMFRNPKMAAYVYMSQQEERPFLEVSSLMAMGEHPESAPGKMYIFTNADEVRLYRNDSLIGTFAGRTSGRPRDDSEESTAGFRKARPIGAERERWPNLKHPPILIDQMVPEDIGTKEGFTPEQAADVRELLNYAAVYGFDELPFPIKAKAAKLMLKYRMTYEDAYQLFGKYVGVWGQEAVVYRFEAVKDGRVIKRMIRAAANDVIFDVNVDHTDLVEKATYDVASVRIVMRDQNGTALPFFMGSVKAEVTGPISVIGPKTVQIRGGMGGLYIRSELTGDGAPASLKLTNEQAGAAVVNFTVRKV